MAGLLDPMNPYASMMTQGGGLLSGMVPGSQMPPGPMWGAMPMLQNRFSAIGGMGGGMGGVGGAGGLHQLQAAPSQFGGINPQQLQGLGKALMGGGDSWGSYANQTRGLGALFNGTDGSGYKLAQAMDQY